MESRTVCCGKRADFLIIISINLEIIRLPWSKLKFVILFTIPNNFINYLFYLYFWWNFPNIKAVWKFSHKKLSHFHDLSELLHFAKHSGTPILLQVPKHDCTKMSHTTLSRSNWSTNCNTTNLCRSRRRKNTIITFHDSIANCQFLTLITT